MIQILNIKAIRSAQLRDSPFNWASVSNVVSAADQLEASFPTNGFTDHVRLAGEKPYRLASRPLIEVDGSVSKIGDLADCWIQLVDELMAPSYRAALSHLTDVDLADSALGVTLWRYPILGFLGPHRDEQYKLVSHVIYLNKNWKRCWGGALKLLESADGEVSSEVTPGLGNSVVIVRSESSWHSVAPVTDPSTLIRQSLQAVFYMPGFGINSD